jgi:methyl-accepting chemotaxis protein
MVLIPIFLLSEVSEMPGTYEFNAIADAIRGVSTSLKDGSGVAIDATGGAVGSVTEAMLGITAGLVQIANAIEYHADVIKEAAATND